MSDSPLRPSVGLLSHRLPRPNRRCRTGRGLAVSVAWRLLQLQDVRPTTNEIADGPPMWLVHLWSTARHEHSPRLAGQLDVPTAGSSIPERRLVRRWFGARCVSPG